MISGDKQRGILRSKKHYKSTHPPRTSPTGPPPPPDHPVSTVSHNNINCTFFNCYCKSISYNSILVSLNCSSSSDSRKMPTISENALQQAIDAVLAGASLRRASTTHGVPRTTLVRRLEGKLPSKQAQVHHQRLSPWQEENLVDWILVQGALGLPPTHAQIRQFVTRILAHNGDTQPLGKRWMEGFFARNPQVKTLRGKSIESRRVNGASAENIKAFFQLLSIPKVQAIKPCNRWNMDETGIMQGHRGNGLVVGKASRKHILVKSAGSREWVTIVEAGSAVGNSLPPLIIFRGKDVQQQWFPACLEEWESWRFTASPNGWTSNDIGQKWLEDIFIPLTACVTG